MIGLQRPYQPAGIFSGEEALRDDHEQDHIQPDGAEEDFWGASIDKWNPAPPSIYLFGLFLALLALPAITAVSLGDASVNPRPASWSRRLLGWSFLSTKIALLLYTGEQFPTQEATTLFFGISKLFQNKDASLRQMVHLIIKELAHSAEDIIMVTSTIMKDTGGGTDAIYRPNAIRALCRIIDVSYMEDLMGMWN